MGILISKIIRKLFGQKEIRVLILGLDNAGKTTVLYKLHSPHQVMRTTPTIGFNVETIQVKNLTFQVWDLGGQTNIRPYWRCYYANTNAIVYVVDSQDKERIALARKELMAMLEEEELKETVLLVMANKQDQPGALSAAEVSKALALHQIKNRPYYVCQTCAIKGEGLAESMDWLSNTIAARF